MKKGIGILWNDPNRWQLGKNCHSEQIVCPGCAAIETATVLHGNPTDYRFHRCGNCGKLIGFEKWKLAEPPPASRAEPTAEMFAAPAPGCFICDDQRQTGLWQNCETCKTPTPKAGEQIAMF